MNNTSLLRVTATAGT